MKEIRRVQLKAARARYMIKINTAVNDVLAKFPGPVGIAMAAAITGAASERLHRLWSIRVRRNLRRQFP